MEGERARDVGRHSAGGHAAGGRFARCARSLVVLIISWIGRAAAVAVAAPPPRMCVFLHWAAAAAAAERAAIAWVLQTEVTD